MKKRQKLTSKKWLRLFLSTILGLTLLFGAFNVVTDPFGAFGDRFMQWWSYDMTQNPRVSKISYLKQHAEDYDSFIIGSSASSSFPSKTLEKYTAGSWFNMIMYGSDMLDVEQTAFWLAENCKVKNLMIVTHAHDAMQYDINSGKLTDIMHCDADGSDPLAFYSRYLFADWRYGWAKIKNRLNDSYVQASYDCFNEEDGAYDKSKRDVEPIGNLDEYLSREDYSIFKNYPKATYNISAIDQTMGSLQRIKELCDEKDIRMTIVCPPMYGEYLNYFTKNDLITFGTRLSEISDFWDFSMSSASWEPRYFYDESHFRNALGDMCLAKMFGDADRYVPEDLGHHVYKGNAQTLLAEEFAAVKEDPALYTALVPILTYHETYPEQAEYGITTALFEEHMAALYEAGAHAVSFNDLRAYVEKGTPLPEKPFVVTFDDGYTCNLQEAAPILEKYGFQGTIFSIGVSVGKDTYKKTGHPMNPHFGAEEARPWIEKGVISVQSHGNNIHQVEGLDDDPIRPGILQMEGEDEAEYIRFLRDDAKTMKSVLLSMGEYMKVLAYPHGKYSQLADIILAEEGIDITVTTDVRVNTLVKGLPQSLMRLGRFSMERDVTAAQLLEKLGY